MVGLRLERERSPLTGWTLLSLIWSWWRLVFKLGGSFMWMLLDINVGYVKREYVNHDSNGLHHWKNQEILFKVLWPAEAEAETWNTTFLFFFFFDFFFEFFIWKANLMQGDHPTFFWKGGFSSSMSGISKNSDV